MSNASPNQLISNRAQQSTRYLSVDILRGVAIVMMIAFHFTYDLNYFHFVTADFYHDPFWLNFRTLILSLFLVLVGFSLQLAAAHKLNYRRHLRRLALLIGAAVAVTVGSFLIFPDMVILFGVLHFIALASVLGLLFLRFYWINLLLGVGVVVLDLWFQHAWFNQPAWHWIGLMTHKPTTLDYVPLLPWFGVVLVGMFLARLALKYELLSTTNRGGNSLTLLLALSGRHSLFIYIIHQPLFFGILYLVRLVFW